MNRNWRGQAARVQFYFNEGSISLQQFKQALYAAAALKIIFEWTVLTAVLATPLIFAAMLLWGVVWIRHGWYKHLAEVPTIDAVTPISMWPWHMQVKLYRKLDIDLYGDDLSTMPKELQPIMASQRKDST